MSCGKLPYEMQKPKLQNKCKLCGLIHIDRDLWTEVHDRIINEGAKRIHVCKWLNKRIELLNANLKEGQPESKLFNVSNFTVHFKKHVSNEKQMKAELRAALKDAPRANDGFTVDEYGVAEVVIKAEQAALAESYKVYPETVSKIETVILQDLASMDGIIDAHGKLRPSAADSRLRLLQNLIGVKRSLADVQRTEQIGGSAVRHALVRISEEVVSVVNKMAVELKETLKQQLPESSLPDDVEKMIVSRVVKTIKGVYSDILAEVYKLYGIK